MMITIFNIFMPSPAQAQAIAISGSFYRYHFQLQLGESLDDPDVYIRVYNPGDEDISINLTAETPPDVAITFSDSEFTVAAGENLYRIALRYNMTWTTLAAANGITNPDFIVVGQVLQIPG